MRKLISLWDTPQARKLDLLPSLALPPTKLKHLRVQASTPDQSAPELKLSHVDLLRREFQAVIKAQGEDGVYGCGLQVCWGSRQPGRQSATDVETASGTVTGNSANTQQVARNEAK